MKIDYKEILQRPNIYIDKIDLNVQLGTQDAALTAILTGIIAGGLGIILRKPKYQVNPIYANKNFIKINNFNNEFIYHCVIIIIHIKMS